MTSFSLSARLTAPAKRKMLIGDNKFGEKTKFHKIKHMLCHGLGAAFFLEIFSLVLTWGCAHSFDS